MEPTPTTGPISDRAAFRDQRIADLGYFLCRGAVDLGALTVLERRDVTLAPGLQAALVVLGASHAVELRWGDQRATEVLACSGLPRGADVVARLSPAAATRGDDGGAGDVERRFDLPGLALEVRLRVAADDAEQRERVRRILADPSFAHRGVAVRFPPGRGTRGGLTLVVAGRDGQRIETLHSYPAEGRVVLTETRCVR